jgi:hypothetical protein
MLMQLENSIATATLEVEIQELRKANAKLQQDLVRAKSKVEDLVEATQTAAYQAVVNLGAKPKITPAKIDKRRSREQVALWHLTDWQLGKKTVSYNSEVGRQRVQLFVNKAAQITEIQRADHPVKKCVIMFGGDMVEGCRFNFPSQPFEVDSTTHEQWLNAAKIMAETVAAALAIYESVEVISEWGNHGRIGSTRDGLPRHDNIDRMAYMFAREMLSGEKRLIWEDSPEDIRRVEIGNYRALLIHGDEVGRNGFASPSTIVQHITRWKSGSYDWDFRDVYLGHYHTHNEWAMSNGLGSVFQTGSTESDNRYAGVMLAATATPSQRLHFIDPVKGRVSSVHKVWLDE